MITLNLICKLINISSRINSTINLYVGPQVDHALSAMYKVWLSVMAVLAVQFAKTVALSVSISEFLQKPVDRFLSPVIQIVVPDEYDKWVPILLNW